MVKLLVVAATAVEISPVLDFLEKDWTSAGPYQYQKDQLQVDVLITGVGLTATAFALGAMLSQRKYQLAIQAGIGGAIDRQFKLGQVIQIKSERFADLGADTADGGFLDLTDLGFLPTDPDSPFEADGRILANLPTEDQQEAGLLPGIAVADAISVNRVSGYAPAIQQLFERYPDAQVESMEGAAFFYSCRMRQQACAQLRAISNYVAARDKSSWKIGPAVAALNTQLKEIIEGFAAATNA